MEIHSVLNNPIFFDDSPSHSYNLKPTFPVVPYYQLKKTDYTSDFQNDDIQVQVLWNDSMTVVEKCGAKLRSRSKIILVLVVKSIQRIKGSRFDTTV